MATVHGSPTERMTYATRSDGNLWPRWLNALLGMWLFISAWIWPHTPSSTANTWIVGLIITAVAIVAIWMPVVRWVNAAAAVWLFISTLVIPHATSGTVWNNVIVAVAVFILSLAPSTALKDVGRHAPAT